jgi:histidinol-phosphate/aromatic aminotransferase/cobyric acid decarboxylase-like protein
VTDGGSRDDSVSRRTLRKGEFAEDDYEEVMAEYFQEIIHARCWSAMPAGWYNPRSAGAEIYRPQAIGLTDLQRYALDEGRALGELKLAILRLVSAWEASHVTWDELTLCPSVSTANLAVLRALKSRGVDAVVMESPAYFATVDQARLVGLSVRRVAASLDEGFEAPVERFVAAARGVDRPAFWITHPRFGIGSNQSLERVRSFASAVGRGRVLVVDEAAEQMFPSLLSRLGDVPCDLLRTRGVVKGVGLNGLRVAMILHPERWRDPIERGLETVGASLDRYSLANAAAIADTPGLLSAMLNAANDQVRRLQKRLSVITVGSWAQPTPLSNGYIGSIILDLTSLPASYETKRAAILAHCRSVRLPVVLRASIGFSHDPDWEAVRINYFTPDENVERTGQLLAEAQEAIRRRLAGGNC